VYAPHGRSIFLGRDLLLSSYQSAEPHTPKIETYSPIMIITEASVRRTSNSVLRTLVATCERFPGHQNLTSLWLDEIVFWAGSPYAGRAWS